MKSLEINLEKIAKAAIEKQKENVSFGNFLKTQDSKAVDDIVHRLDQEITPKIDCLACGNCCRNLRPVVTEEAMSPFVEPKNMEAYKYLKGFTCKNLDCNSCTIYEERPEECRQYPYLHRDQFVERTSELIQNYEVCPIIFNVFEQLKEELNWADI
tara:strand:+ start:188 stop:655 length:468 start_codon:yes stop_codon:yes gene_type:complete